MVLERAKELMKDYSRAVKKLKEALDKKAPKGDIVVDGAIQRFEFTFELAWKLAMRILEHNGIDAATPRSVIKETFKMKIITDGDGWIDMLEDRNKTSHIYDEDQAFAVYEKIRDVHYKSLEEFKINAEKYILLAEDKK